MDSMLAAKLARWWLLFYFGVLGIGAIGLLLFRYFSGHLKVPWGFWGVMFMIVAFSLVNVLAFVGVALRAHWAVSAAAVACSLGIARHLLFVLYKGQFSQAEVTPTIFLIIALMLLLAPNVRAELRTKVRAA
jgi:hypothetical protein